MISLKYLFEKRRERFISATALISAMGITVGVAALIVTMGVMNGFNKEIEEKILSVNPHIIIGSDGPMDDAAGIADKAAVVGGVVKSAEFLDGQALINHNGRMMGVLVRGIQRSPDERLVRMGSFMVSGSPALRDDGVILGSELARNFRIDVGDRVSLVSPLTKKTEEFGVTGIFSSGRYDYDLNMVFLSIEKAAALLGRENIVNGIGLKVDDVFGVEKIKRKLSSLVAPAYWVMTWKDIDKNLFSALKLEKIVMFLLVTLIICVACFNIISTLVMTIMEKTRDIGILKTIGATRSGIMSVFLLEGFYISFLGIASGAALGLGLCYLQIKYELVKLPPDVYYIYSVPVSISAPDTFIILASAFALGILATVYPSLHASRLEPVDVLRYG
jgi:lipoprotein-releasing system permease protein